MSRTLLGAGKVDQGFSDAELLSLASEPGELPSLALEFTTVPITVQDIPILSAPQNQQRRRTPPRPRGTSGIPRAPASV